MDKKLQVQKVYPLTSMQEGMLFHAIAHEHGSSMYSEQISFKIHGNINLKIFQRCFDAIIERYDVFRTNFVYKKVHRPVQVVLKERKGIINQEDITALDETEKEMYLDDFKKKDIKKGFDLSKDLLLRLTLLKIGESTSSMIWTVHHIIIDGWCMGIVTKEFFQIYHSMVTNTPLYLDRVEPYENFIHWLEKQDKKAAAEFWEEYLDGYKLKAVLPFRNANSISNEYAKSEYEFPIDKDTTQKLQRIASTNEVTLNTVFQALYGILLQKYNGKDEVVFGSVVSGRPAQLSGVESMVGLFINNVPVRVSCSKEDSSKETSFSDLIKSIYNCAIDASMYHYYPLSEIQDKSALRGELFDSLMIFENYPMDDEITNMDIFNRVSLTISDFENFDQTNYPLNFFVYIGDSLTIRLSYNSNVYGQETISMLEKNVLDAAKAISENPDIQIEKLKILTDDEKKFINEYNFNNRLVDKNSTNLAISATFTSEPVEDYIKWWCRKFDTPVNISFASYNQVFQELLDPGSLISSNTGMNILLVRFEDWIRDEHAETSILLEKLNRNFEELKALIDRKEKTVPYFIGLFPAHLIFDNEITNHLIELGEKWKSYLGDMKNVYTVDFTQLETDYSFDGIFDKVRDKAGHIPFTDEFYSAMGTELARKMCTYRSQPFKVIVLDCDNTLWKGICGEDGFAGIAVDEAYTKLQSIMVQKSKEGMLLALCSKNNEADAWEVFEKNESMLLKKEHIAAWRINWNPKSENIKEIARELNLGIDSFIFLDDSPMECSEVMSNCPEVLTLQLPQESEDIPLFLKHIWAFDRLKVTEEDKLRTSMYVAEKLRKEKQEETVTLDDFLKSLELKMSIGIMEESQLSRVSQLTQRTNQFNLSTIRRTEKDISDILQKPGVTCAVIEVSDRFGDYGLVGVLIMQEEKAKLNIETLLLSCRVLGRRIEDAILYCIGKYWREKGINTLEAKFYQTEKNKPVLEFLERSGWVEYERTAEYIGFCMEFDKLPLNEGFVECYIDTKYTKNQPSNYESKEGKAPDHAVSGGVDSNKKDTNKSYRKANWKVNVQNENNLSHKKYFLPLLYHSAQDIIDKSIKELYDMSINQEEHISQTEVEYSPPVNETENGLVSIWQDILRIEKMSVNGNFFRLGGNSLKAVALVSKIYEKFEIDISMNEIFQFPTIRGLGEYINGVTKSKHLSIEPVEEKDNHHLFCAQKLQYFYQEDGNTDDFVLLLPCTDALLYFIMKRKLPDITKPYEIFVQDITFCLQQNEDDSIYDLNTTDYMINQDVFKTQYSYSGRGQEALLEVEALLDRGELVIIQTYSERLPFFKYFKGLDTYDEKFVPGHTFLAVGHDRERLYYVEAPWNINSNNFVSYKGNKSIGVISKEELKYAFDIFVNCVTVEIINDFGGVASLKNDRMKLAVEGTIKNYYKKSHTSGKLKVSYGREAIDNLIAICERRFLNLNQKVDSFPLKLVDLLDWKFNDISKTRGLLLGCLSKYADQYGQDSCYGLVDLLDSDLSEWKQIIYTILQMEKKGEHMLDTSVKKNFMKIADIEEKIIDSLQKLKF